MNRVAKGSRVEKRCADELRTDGYLVWKTIRHQFLNIDLWGYFDVVALEKNGKHVRLIQCKTNKCDKATIERIRALKVPGSIYKEVWIYHDRKGFEKRLIGTEDTNETEI